jgi:hypothetical protein
MIGIKQRRLSSAQPRAALLIVRRRYASVVSINKHFTIPTGLRRVLLVPGGKLMKSYSLTMIMAVVLAIGLQSIVLASGWNRSVTITSLSENNVNGEVVQFTVNEVVDNSGHCPDKTGYAIRDPATLRGSLALLTSALVAQRQIDLFVTGTCDSTGMPNVIGVTLR